VHVDDFGRKRLGLGFLFDHALDLLHLARRFLLHIFDRLERRGLAVLVGLVRDIGRLRLGNMHRTTDSKRTTRRGGGQFRKGHTYRHVQSLFALPEGSNRPGLASWAFPCFQQHAKGGALQSH
jgi:hypothetical protein